MKKDKVKQPYVPPEVKEVQQPEPKETTAEGSWISSIGGRKFVLILLTMIGVVVVGCARGDVPTKDITDTLVWLAGIGAGSIAIEDGLGRISSRKG